SLPRGSASPSVRRCVRETVTLAWAGRVCRAISDQGAPGGTGLTETHAVTSATPELAGKVRGRSATPWRDGGAGLPAPDSLAARGDAISPIRRAIGAPRRGRGSRRVTRLQTFHILLTIGRSRELRLRREVTNVLEQGRFRCRSDGRRD